MKQLHEIQFLVLVNNIFPSAGLKKPATRGSSYPLYLRRFALAAAFLAAATGAPAPLSGPLGALAAAAGALDLGLLQ